MIKEQDTTAKHVEKLKILAIQISPSLTIRNRLDYSPLDLRTQTWFCIITAHTGPMDAVAHTDRAYTGWIRQLMKLCHEQEATLDNRNWFSSTRNCDETDDDDSVEASSPWWTEHSFVHKHLQQKFTSGKRTPYNHFFTSPISQNGS